MPLVLPSASSRVRQALGWREEWNGVTGAEQPQNIELENLTTKTECQDDPVMLR